MTTKKLFGTLSKNLNIFIDEVNAKKLTLMATDQWSVKDELCHLVFWHENYAANYKALALGQDPPLLDGPGYRLNKEGVASLRKYSVSNLISRLRKANSILEWAILIKKVPKMTYKKNGRVFNTPEFLDLLARHFATHTKQVRRAKL